MEIRFLDITDGMPPRQFYYDAFWEKVSELLKMLRKECGALIKGIYTDNERGRKLGLVFTKKIPSGQTQETWVIITPTEYQVMRKHF